jgi:hypothetical protein
MRVKAALPSQSKTHLLCQIIRLKSNQETKKTNLKLRQIILNSTITTPNLIFIVNVPRVDTILYSNFHTILTTVKCAHHLTKLDKCLALNHSLRLLPIILVS